MNTSTRYRVTLPIENEFQVEVLIDKGSVELLINAVNSALPTLFTPKKQASVALNVDSGSLAQRNVQVSSLAGENMLNERQTQQALQQVLDSVELPKLTKKDEKVFLERLGAALSIFSWATALLGAW